MSKIDYSELIEQSSLYQEILRKSRKISHQMMISLYSFGLLFFAFYLTYAFVSENLKFSIPMIPLLVIIMAVILFSFYFRENNFPARFFLALNFFLLILTMKLESSLYFEIILVSVFPIISYLFLKMKEAIIFNWSYFSSCVLLFFPLHSQFKFHEVDISYYMILLATFIVVSIITFYSKLEHQAHIKDMINKIFYDNKTELPDWQLLKLKLQTDAGGHMAIFRISNFFQIHKAHGADFSGKFLYSVKNDIVNNPVFNNIELFKLREGDFILLWDRSFSLIDVELNLKKIMETYSIFSISMDGKIIYLKGVSGAVPAIGNPKDILHNAEYALEIAEIKQKTHVLIADHEKREDYDEYSRPFQMLLECFEHNRIQLIYQPIIDLKTKALIKVEALVRFFDSRGRNLDIAPILKSTYATGMNKKLTRFILDRASLWAIDNECDISVNIGFEDLINSDIIKCILAVLLNFKENNRKLTLEILESSTILDTDMSYNNLLILRHSGALIAIDDFGSGFANFDRVFSLHPDIIKFDGSLIKQLPYSEDARYLVSMVKKLAERNGMETVAEQVEDREILNFVEKYDIDHVQGYFFGKPSPELKYRKMTI